MKILSLSEKSSLSGLLDVLRRGAVLVLPSDTIYGFSCQAGNKKAIDRIYEIKNRPKEKSFIILCSSLKMIKKYFVINSFQEKVLQIFLNDAKARPTTFILEPKKDNLSFFSGQENMGVAVRLPKNKFLSKMIEELKTPIISTSCNLSGHPSLNNLNKIFSFFKKQKHQADYLVRLKKYRPKRRPSRIIDIRESDNLKIIRE